LKSKAGNEEILYTSNIVPALTGWIKFIKLHGIGQL